MKKGTILIVLVIIIVIGALYIILNTSNNNNNNHNNNNSTFILNTVALTLDDIGEDYQLIDENYWKDRNFTNATGNGITWKQIEHYQSSFIEKNNTTGPISPYDKKNVTLQTITKLESKEKADLFVDLWIDGRQKKGYLNIPIEPIGYKSAYFFDIESSRSYDIDRYMLCFSIDDIVVVVFNDGVNLTQSRAIEFAKIIENNILNLLY